MLLKWSLWKEQAVEAGDTLNCTVNCSYCTIIIFIVRLFNAGPTAARSYLPSECSFKCRQHWARVIFVLRRKAHLRFLTRPKETTNFNQRAQARKPLRHRTVVNKQLLGYMALIYTTSLINALNFRYLWKVKSARIFFKNVGQSLWSIFILLFACKLWNSGSGRGLGTLFLSIRIAL